MKRGQIILFTLFIIISGAIYLALLNNKKEETKEIKDENQTLFVPIQSVQNKVRSVTTTSYGQVLPNSEIMVSFEVQGKLEKGNITMKPGTNFKKGQILYRVNNEEAFYTLNARKATFSTLILNSMPDIELDFPSERNKWIAFLNDLSSNSLLPNLPQLSSSKEQMFVISRNIEAEYFNLKSLEARMGKYSYKAPFNGTVTQVFAEPGAIANPGGQIARIAKTGQFELKVPIALKNLDLFKGQGKTLFTDAQGEVVASGSILRISDVVNQQTQSADVYYSILPMNDERIYNGMFLNVTTEQKHDKKTVILPRTAINKGSVYTYKNSTLSQLPVVIEGTQPDSVLVSGIPDGTMVVIEEVTEFDKTKKYEGILR